MADYICIDGGTTNTRVYLVRNYRVVDTVSIGFGARKGNEDQSALKTELKNAIHALLDRNRLAQSDITRILASGMITSEFGLHRLEHAKVPVGIYDLHESMAEVSLPDICLIPFVFIRGVKTCGKDIDRIDIMRGEETELMGIMDEASKEECVYLLPGSHSKIIYTDRSGRITDFVTTMTGEMIYSLSKHTILKNSISIENTELDAKFLIMGYRYCLAEGINKALFKVRISDTILNEEKTNLYSFFMGTVLYGEITEILKRLPARIVIGGKKQIKDALYIILKNISDIDVIRIEDGESDTCVALGAVKIFEFKGVR